MVRTRLDVKWFLRDLFLSRWFYSPDCTRTRLSSPVEYVVGSIRTLGARWAAPNLVGQLAEMGQRLYAPPNVKGWDGETLWINSSTLAARQKFASEVANLNDESPLGNSIDLSKFVPNDLKEPAAVVEALSDKLLQGDLPTEPRSDLAEYLVTLETEGDEEVSKTDRIQRGIETFRDDEDVRANRIRQAIGIVLSLPDYQSY